MTNNDEDDIDVDADVDLGPQEDFERAPEEKISLRETWESNPLLKVAAIAMAAAVVVGGYLIFFGGPDVEDNQSVVSSGSGAGVKTTPGGEEVLDPEYRKALEEQNKQRIEEAVTTGGSAIPTPTGPTAPTVPDILKDVPQEDPLKEWRARVERNQQMQTAAMTPDTTIQPEAAPLMQPVRPQQMMITADPEMARNLTDQMRVIVAAQAPSEIRQVGVTSEDSAYIALKKKEDAARRAIEASAFSSNAGTTYLADGTQVQTAAAEQKVIVPAGNIAYAQLLNELNSDISGPALAQVLSGPLEGGRALGQFSLKDEYLVITFNRVVKNGVSYAINAIALDTNTTLGGHQTDVDHHYFTRVVLPAAAKFVEGYGSAVAETGQTTTETAGGAVGEEQPEPDTRQELMKATGEAASKLSEILDESTESPITVKVAKGTEMGLLFVDSVMTGSVEQR